MTDPSSLVPGGATRLAAGARAPQEHRAPLLGPVAGRMLVQIRPNRVGWVRRQLDPGRSGVVLCGKGAMKKAAVLRQSDQYTGTLLVDPAIYERAFATADEPFPQIDDGTLPLDDPLRYAVAEQLAVGASRALTPTGYIQAEDADALKAAVTAIRDLDEPRAIFVVPIDVAWLGNEDLPQLIAWLQQVDRPKAVILGGQKDPLARFKASVGNLHRLIREVPDVALMRTDLAAFGTLAHGAWFTAIGHSSALRHAVPPGQEAERSKGFGLSPHVLFPELMDYFLGQTLEQRFATAEQVPVCGCAACAGRALDTFPDNTGASTMGAASHNVAVLMEWLRTLTTMDPGIARQRWWQERCREAVARYPVVNTAIGQPRRFKPGAQLTRWAELELSV